jgi:DNA polymerase elongation subunit (family B)
MELDSFFVYSWNINEEEKNITSIRAYGLDKNNENVCVRIDDFTPYVYVELPERIEWNDTRAQLVGNKIDELLGESKPIKKSLVYKKKLYFAYLDKNKSQKLFPYLFLSFSSKNDINSFIYRTKKPISIQGVGFMKMRVHEQDASPILQLTCARDIPSSGWITFKGKPVPEEEKVTHCKKEFTCKWKNLSPKTTNETIKPLIMGYDIEVYSSDPNRMPIAAKEKDVIFQISCVFSRTGDDEKQYEKHLLSLFDPEPQSGIILVKCENEIQLLQEFVDLIQKKQPNIICGYNIFTFDIPYMIERSKKRFMKDSFDRQGFDKFGHAKEKTISWSSSAYKNQEFQYLDAEGRLFVDLLPLIRRDYKMDSYSLKNISNHFLGETKDPLTPKGIFKCYELGKNNHEKGKKAMGIVGKYCVQDSVLVLKLFDKLQTWFGLTEMANICNVPIFSLYTQGQQIKVYSQMYKKCMSENVVVEKDGYIPKEDEHYQGAHVFEPVPGVYDCVVPFDFASLYPSIIIAYNIDYSTLIPEESDISDRDCHVIEWDEHIGCEHEEKKRKSKPKHILCGHRRFRFLKTHKGILPTLLEDLLAARKKTRTEIKEIEAKLKSNTLSKTETDTYTTLLNVLDKRQLSYKISANSGYGAMGVSRGYLPLMPGAMCVTAKGRQSIELVAEIIPRDFNGKLIYGDTDSNYVTFPHLKTPKEIWEYAEKVSEEVSKNFPKPMKLEFEGVIYWRFLILTMKRYMSLKCDKEGNIGKKIEKKGVLLSRRDNSNFVRTVYSDIIMKVFDRKEKEDVLYDCIQHINNLCAYNFSTKDFIITKSVGSVGDLKPQPIPNSKNKVMIGNYKVPLLPTNEKERQKQFKLKDTTSESEYYIRCLPAQVQLAEKIKRRGGRVDVGTRLEYVILRHNNEKAKQYEKIESADYYKEHTSSLVLDHMYYLKALANPLDQVFSCVFNIQDFTLNQYKQGILKRKMIEELKNIFRPRLIFLE